MIRKGGTVIDSLETWERLAPPREKVQWKEYKSAQESARAWLEDEGRPGIPDEVLQAVAPHEDFGEILEWEAEPECLVKVDGYRNPPNIDVMVHARDSRGPFVVAVEAKGDETFGPLMGDALSDALERYLESPRSNGIARAQELTSAILTRRGKGDPGLRQVRYQLLTLIAGALSRAAERGAERAIALIHEFRTPLTRELNQQGNSEDLARLLRRLGRPDDIDVVLTGRGLAGPIRVPGGGRFSEPASLYIGKVTRVVEARE